MNINTDLGTFVPNGTQPLSSGFKDQISLLFGPEAITSIALTVLNFVVGLGVIALVLLDNRRIYKTWRVTRWNRVPLALATAICLSHAVFIVKSFLGLASFHRFNPPKDVKLLLLSLGIWAPLVTIVIRSLFAVLSISLHFDPYAAWSEGVMILLIALISFACFLPAFTLPSSHRCTPFIVTFFNDSDDGFGLAASATIILSVLLLLLLMGMIILGYETGLLKRTTSSDLNGLDLELSPQSQLGKANRNLVYYGTALLLQYSLLLPNFVLSGLGTLNIPVNFLASIILHLSSIVLLLQYLFGQRKSRDRTLNRESTPWKTSLEEKKKPGERWGWWRKESVSEKDTDTLPSLSALATSRPLPPTPDSPKSSLAPTELSDLKTRRLSRNIPRAWSRQTEIPSHVYLPRLTILTEGRQSVEASEGSSVVLTKSPLSRLKQTLKSPEPLRMSKRSGMTLIPDPIAPSPLRVTQLMPDGTTSNLGGTSNVTPFQNQSVDSRVFVYTPDSVRETAHRDGTLRGMKRPITKSMILGPKNTTFQQPSEMRPFRPAPVPRSQVPSDIGGGMRNTSTRYYL